MRTVVVPWVVSIAALAQIAGASGDGTAVRRPGPPPRILWRVADEGRGRPAADDAMAYFLSKRHRVVAVSAATGAPRWQRSTDGIAETTEGSAVVLAGSVLVAGDWDLIAFDRATGAFRWRFIPAVGYAPGFYLGGASGRTVFAGSPAGRVYAVDAETGDLRWSTLVVDDGQSTVFQPAVEGPVLVAGFTSFGIPHTGGVTMLDTESGRVLWRTWFPASSYNRTFGTGSTGYPVFTDSAIVATAGNGFVYGLSRTTGAILWSLPPITDIPAILQGPFPLPPSPEGADFRPLSYSAGMLFVGSLKGQVVAYDLATRKERWRYHNERSGSVAFALTSDERSVYVPYTSGHHIAFNVQSGAERWHTETSDDGLTWPAYVHGDRIYLSGTEGGFFAMAR